MKKYYVVMITILIFLIIGLLPYLINEKFEKLSSVGNEDNHSTLSLFVRQRDGNYAINNDFSWQERGYNLNTQASQCDNNGQISWNNATKEVILDSQKSSKCKLYFDFDYNNYINDLSGNGNNGEFNNVVQNNDGLKIDQGYINTYIVNHDFTKGLSFVIKLKINDFSKGMAIIGNWDGEKGGGIYYASNKCICLDLYELPTDRTVCTSKPYLENTLYTLIGTYDNQNMKLYVINASTIEEYSKELSGVVTTQELAPIVIGMDPDIKNNQLEGHNYTDITVKEALVFSRALSKEEITKNYIDKINPENKSNLLVWYKYAD